jgi:two-component system, response regulator PdtaR
VESGFTSDQSSTQRGKDEEDPAKWNLCELAHSVGRSMVGARVELRLGQEAEVKPAILVVDDEVLVRMMIADKLRNAGYAVVEAADADEAIDVLARTLNVKLVLTDIQMPGSMDGVGLCRVVRSAHPVVKILLTSGRCAAVGDVEHDGFFPKPYDIATIVSHIQTLLD